MNRTLVAKEIFRAEVLSVEASANFLNKTFYVRLFHLLCS